VIMTIRTNLSREEFVQWGWRIPFLISIGLLAISVWIRLAMNESPAFQKMKSEGRTSKAPLTEAFGEWKNMKIVILALLGLTAGQAVVWYTGQFYARIFMIGSVLIDENTVDVLLGIALLIGTPLFIVFGSLSDKIGRKPIIMLGCLLAAFTYRPAFEMLTQFGNPDLFAAQQKSQVVLIADPNECSVQFNPTGTSKFTSSCDVAKQKLAARAVSYDSQSAPTGTKAIIKIGDMTVDTNVTPQDISNAKDAEMKKLETLKSASPLSEKAVKDAEAKILLLDDKAKNKDAVISANLALALKEAKYPTKANPEAINKPMVVLILFYLVVLVTMVYGPIAAMLVEMFPTRIRYTSMSLPYHIGNGWFGGLLPASAVAIVAQTGNMYNGLWYPIIIAGSTAVIGLLFIKETKDVDIYAND